MTLQTREQMLVDLDKPRGTGRTPPLEVAAQEARDMPMEDLRSAIIVRAAEVKLIRRQLEDDKESPTPREQGWRHRATHSMRRKEAVLKVFRCVHQERCAPAASTKKARRQGIAQAALEAKAARSAASVAQDRLARLQAFFEAATDLLDPDTLRAVHARANEALG